MKVFHKNLPFGSIEKIKKTKIELKENTLTFITLPTPKQEKLAYHLAKQNAKYVEKDCVLFLQPEWSNKEKVMPLISKFILENPNWRLSLQTHKYIGFK